MGILTLKKEASEYGLLRFSLSELATLHGIASNLLNASYGEEYNVTLSPEQFTVLYKIVGSVEDTGSIVPIEGELA